MKLTIGVATASLSENPQELIDALKAIAVFQTDAIEISLTKEQKMQHPWTDEIFQLIRQFKYRSIHAPVRDTDGNLVLYPSDKGSQLLTIIDKIAVEIGAHTILFHPDLVKDFSYLTKKYGDKLAFENMDNNKSFGRTVADMEKVFKKASQAKWVFDINHVYTNDPTMKLADDLYTAFKDRLCHYHISSFGGFHDCFYHTHENIILKGLKDFDHPMIHEGNAYEKGIMKEEIEYIKEQLLSHPSSQ